MKFRFTIARKLAIGFGILTIAFVINTFLTLTTLQKSREVNEQINTIYAPSSEYLSSLQEMIANSKLLIKNWVFIERTPSTPDKVKLMNLHTQDFPNVVEHLDEISKLWAKEDRETYRSIVSGIRDTLFVYHKMVMETLNDFTAYDDPMVMFEVEPMVSEGGEIMGFTEITDQRLSDLIKKQEGIASAARNEMVKAFNDFQKTIWIMGIILLVAVILIAIITTRALVVPINYMKRILLDMSSGIISDEKIKSTNDEIGEMAIAMNQLMFAFKQISDFAIEIGKGNFNSHFEPLSDKDKLGYSLIEMRNNLKNASEHENTRKQEDAQRAWSSNGIAKFSDILRNNNNNIEALAYDIISNLVKYLNASQGGLFVMNDNNDQDIHIEMKGCYAYDRQKFLSKRIEMNEGIIGRCVQEGETLFITDIPDNYMNITSGLGENKPRCLLVVPMAINDRNYGVIEIASFRSIDQYQIDFVHRLGESIASTLATVKNNMKTNFLLEKTQIQAEEMLSQEEEMRQNMEELQATQEESERRELELKQEIQDLKSKINVKK